MSVVHDGGRVPSHGGIPCAMQILGAHAGPVHIGFCQECPLAADCLEQALRHDDRWGAVVSGRHARATHEQRIGDEDRGPSRRPVR